MIGNGELTRTLNLIESLEESGGAESYKEISKILNKAKDAMDTIKPSLIEERVKAYFPSEGLKVVFREGKERTMINTTEVYNKLPIDQFLSVVKVTESELRKVDPILAAEAKIVLNGKTSPSVVVTKMTKEEIKNYKLGTLEE